MLISVFIILLKSNNIDMTTKQENRMVECEGLLRGKDGRWLCNFLEKKHGFYFYTYVAELWDAMEGLWLAKSRGCTHVELHMDSEIIVKCLKGEGICAVPMGVWLLK